MLAPPMDARRCSPYSSFHTIRDLDAGPSARARTCVRVPINAISLQVEAAKMKRLQERGDAVRYHGQIGGSQTHYTVDDFPLMRRVFAEDLWPILKEFCLFCMYCRCLSAVRLCVYMCHSHPCYTHTRACFCPGEVAPAGCPRGLSTGPAAAVGSAGAGPTAADRRVLPACGTKLSGISETSRTPVEAASRQRVTRAVCVPPASCVLASRKPAGKKTMQVL